MFGNNESKSNLNETEGIKSFHGVAKECERFCDTHQGEVPGVDRLMKHLKAIELGEGK